MRADGLAFVSNSGSSGSQDEAKASDPASVSVIDTRTGAVIATIATEPGPVNPTFSPDGRHVYVAQTGAAALAVIDVETFAVRQLPVGAIHPSGLAFTPDGARLLVTFLGDTTKDQGFLRVVTRATGEVSPPIALGAQPERLVITPDGARAFIANMGDGSVSVVDVARREVTATIPVGEMPFNILISPQGDRVYVGVVRANLIAVIDTASNRVVENFAVTSPNGLAFTPDYAALFVTSVFAGKIEVLSRTTGQQLRSADVGEMPGFIRLSKDGARAYFTRPYGDTVSVLDTATTLAIAGTITVGRAPSVLAVCGAP